MLHWNVLQRGSILGNYNEHQCCGHRACTVYCKFYPGLPSPDISGASWQWWASAVRTYTMMVQAGTPTIWTIFYRWNFRMPSFHRFFSANSCWRLLQIIVTNSTYDFNYWYIFSLGTDCVMNRWKKIYVQWNALMPHGNIVIVQLLSLMANASDCTLRTL